MVFGHDLRYYPAQPFHTLLHPQSTFKYMTMMRQPLAWVNSLFFHFHPKVMGGLNASEAIVPFVQSHIDSCPSMLEAEQRSGR